MGEVKKDQKQSSEVVKMFTHLITSEVSPEELGQILDGLLWHHAQYLLSDTDLKGHPENATPLYYLRELRNICLGSYKPV